MQEYRAARAPQNGLALAMNALVEDYEKFLGVTTDLHDMRNYLNDVRLCFIALTVSGYVGMIIYAIVMCVQRRSRNNRKRSTIVDHNGGPDGSTRYLNGSARRGNIRDYGNDPEWIGGQQTMLLPPIDQSDAYAFKYGMANRVPHTRLQVEPDGDLKSRHLSVSGSPAMGRRQSELSEFEKMNQADSGGVKMTVPPGATQGDKV